MAGNHLQAGLYPGNGIRCCLDFTRRFPYFLLTFAFDIDEVQVTKNIDDFTDYGYGYHGYWQDNFYEVNPHFGTTDDLLALSDALHYRGMFLMVDVVVNLLVFVLSFHHTNYRTGKSYGKSTNCGLLSLCSI